MGIFWYKFIQRIDNIAPHRRIRILVNGNSSSGVRTENKTNAILNFCFGNNILYLISDVY